MPDNKDELTLQQQLFCKLYTTKGITFSNATLSYAEAYQYELPKDEKGKTDIESKEYHTCNANGNRLMINDSIRTTIRKNLLALWNDSEVDARMTEILLNGNEANSIQAGKIYNDLKQRVTKKLDITTGGRPLSGLSDDELDNLAK